MPEPVGVFGRVVAAALSGLVLGGAVCWALGLPRMDGAGWLVLAAAEALTGIAAAMTWPRPAPAAPPPAAAVVPDKAEALRRLRHDVRGALSPALLTADRLLTHADPAVQRAGDIMVRAVERAVTLLTEPPPS